MRGTCMETPRSLRGWQVPGWRRAQRVEPTIRPFAEEERRRLYERQKPEDWKPPTQWYIDPEGNMPGSGISFSTPWE